MSMHHIYIYTLKSSGMALQSDDSCASNCYLGQVRCLHAAESRRLIYSSSRKSNGGRRFTHRYIYIYICNMYVCSCFCERFLKALKCIYIEVCSYSLKCLLSLCMIFFFLVQNTWNLHTPCTRLMTMQI